MSDACAAVCPRAECDKQPGLSYDSVVLAHQLDRLRNNQTVRPLHSDLDYIIMSKTN